MPEILYMGHSVQTSFFNYYRTLRLTVSSLTMRKKNSKYLYSYLSGFDRLLQRTNKRMILRRVIFTRRSLQIL